MDRKGQALVEFTVAVLALIIVLFSIIDVSVMYYVNLTMQRAVREGARYAVTGQSTGDAGVTDLKGVIRNASLDLYDKNALPDKDPKLSVVIPSQATFANYSGQLLTTGTGKPNQIIMVRLTYAWPLLTPWVAAFFPGGRYTFTASATMRHEPWLAK